MQRISSKSNRHFFFDLDGTLLNVRHRLFKLFHELLPNNDVSLETYWSLKRDGVRQATMLKQLYGLDEHQAKYFMSKWIERIEDDRLLALDTPYSGAFELLQWCNTVGKVFIVTGRQNSQKVHHQLEQLGFLAYVDFMLITEHRYSKQNLISGKVSVIPSYVFVGDTFEDIKTGKTLGIRTIGMTHGFMNEKNMRQLGPDHIANDLWEVANILKAQ